MASVNQKSDDIKLVPFKKAIDLSERNIHHFNYKDYAKVLNQICSKNKDVNLKKLTDELFSILNQIIAIDGKICEFEKNEIELLRYHLGYRETKPFCSTFKDDTINRSFIEPKCTEKAINLSDAVDCFLKYPSKDIDYLIEKVKKIIDVLCVGKSEKEIIISNFISIICNKISDGKQLFAGSSTPKKYLKRANKSFLNYSINSTNNKLFLFHTDDFFWGLGKNGFAIVDDLLLWSCLEKHPNKRKLSHNSFKHIYIDHKFPIIKFEESEDNIPMFNSEPECLENVFKLIRCANSLLQ